MLSISEPITVALAPRNKALSPALNLAADVYSLALLKIEATSVAIMLGAILCKVLRSAGRITVVPGSLSAASINCVVAVDTIPLGNAFSSVSCSSVIVNKLVYKSASDITEVV